jgi:hypothetical protein
MEGSVFMKKNKEHKKRKDRPVTQTDKYWYQSGILEGESCQIKEQHRYKDRYYQQMRANHYLVREMDRLDSELGQSKKISLHKRVIERAADALSDNDNPQHRQLASQLKRRLRETEGT